MRPSTEAMATLWSMMTQWFGQLWTTDRGTTPSQAWRMGLEGLTDGEIERGLAQLARTWRSKFPPSLPEFRQLCRPQLAEPEVEAMDDGELVEHALQLGVTSQGKSRKALENAVRGAQRRRQAMVPLQ